MQKGRLFEVLMLAIIASLTLGYILFIRTEAIKESFYVEADLRKADWWLSGNFVPIKLLDRIEIGTNKQDAEVEKLLYFMSEKKDWQTDSDNAIGRITLKLKARKEEKGIVYNDQTLLVNAPLVLEIDGVKLELLITYIGVDKPKDNFVSKKLVVKIYGQVVEYVEPLKREISLKDNTGFEYAKVEGIDIVNSPMIVTDNAGRVFLKTNPMTYDITLIINALVEEKNGRWFLYDGRPIAIGEKFVMNHPLLNQYDAWIIDFE